MVGPQSIANAISATKVLQARTMFTNASIATSGFATDADKSWNANLILAKVPRKMRRRTTAAELADHSIAAYGNAANVHFGSP